MPTYEYECKKCGRFEQFQRITEGKLKKCPTCKGPVKRLLGAGAGIIFKGSGFYQTDYRSESYKRGSKSESASSSSTASTPASSGSASGSGGTAAATTGTASVGKSKQE
jgi:putative FmdB family regulatory protein